LWNQTYLFCRQTHCKYDLQKLARNPIRSFNKLVGSNLVKKGDGKKNHILWQKLECAKQSRQLRNQRENPDLPDALHYFEVQVLEFKRLDL
jgi:hypothetical protein